MSHSPHNRTPEQQQGGSFPTSISRSSLHSSTSSLSPSASVLLPQQSSSPSSFTTRNHPTRTSKTPALSSSNTRNNEKLEQIIQNFYAKTAQIILQSRLTSQQLKTKGRKNKWFNIITDDIPQLKEELQYWKSAIKQQPEEESLPLIIELYLEPPPSILLNHNVKKKRKRKKRIILETWSLSLNHPLPDSAVDLPNFYKRSIIFFRCLHSLVRLLPCYNLHRRKLLKSIGDDYSLSYRISTELTTNNSFRFSDDDEEDDSQLDSEEEIISFDRLLNANDKIKSFEFRDVITPLGTFKLDVLYRDYCHFDTSTPPILYDIDEDFFDQNHHRQYYQQRRTDVEERDSFIRQPSLSRPVSLPSSRSSSSKTSHESSSFGNNNNNSNVSFQRPIGATERRISAPSISPFKSVSLSSSPQAELMFPFPSSSRSQTPEKKSETPSPSSIGRKKEFSSSFEKYKINREPLTKRMSKTTSDHSSIHMESEEEGDLEEFMKFIGSNQDLKLFKTQQDSANSSIMAESSSAGSSLYGSDSLYKSKKALSHFKHIQESHSALSSSISLESKDQQQQQQAQQYPNQSYISSSSSTKSLNQPAVSSPLHTTESITLQKDSSTLLKNKRSTSSLSRRRPSSLLDEEDSLVFKMSELDSDDKSLSKTDEDEKQVDQEKEKQDKTESKNEYRQYQHQSNL